MKCTIYIFLISFPSYWTASRLFNNFPFAVKETTVKGKGTTENYNQKKRAPPPLSHSRLRRNASEISYYLQHLPSIQWLFVFEELTCHDLLRYQKPEKLLTFMITQTRGGGQVCFKTSGTHLGDTAFSVLTRNQVTNPKRVNFAACSLASLNARRRARSENGRSHFLLDLVF